MPVKTGIRDRIVRFERVKASSLLPNPRNWRRHPESQRAALRGMLADVGYADALLVRETPQGLQLVDGHLRAETTPNQEVPVLVLDVTEEEANKLLLTLDPLAAMAQPDQNALLALLADTQFQDKAINDMLEALANGETQPLPWHVASKDGLIWNPAIDTITGEHAEDFFGYDGGSVWMREGDAESCVLPYLLSLPANPEKAKKGALTGNYSRSPAREMEWIVRTYMRPGDRFLEVCAGWWTFSITASLKGYNGAGVDIWDVSLAFAKRQFKKLPKGSGKVAIYEADARKLPFTDNEFDFAYCNPPFFQLEHYSDDPRDLSLRPTVETWLHASGDMMAEMARVVKPGHLIVTVMADYRTKGVLIPLHSLWILEAERRGLILHDLVVQHLLSQQLRFWRRAYKARRTAKAHEYISVFRKPGTALDDRGESLSDESDGQEEQGEVHG